MAVKEQKKQEKTVSQAGKVQGGALAATPAVGSPSKIQALMRYFESARAELSKVSWPTGKEIKVTSIAVVALVAVMAVFLGISDLILAKIVEAILSMGL